jgi:MFS family permease
VRKKRKKKNHRRKKEKMGFLGILEDKHMARVPGTVILDEQVAHSEAVTGHLKHGTGKNAHIVLVPQPSDDPDDPLNWPESRKLTVISIVCYGSILIASVVAPLLSASSAAIAIDLHDSIGSIVLISGYMLLVTAATGPVMSACARKFGKRPCFIFSSGMALVGTIIGATSDNYNRLLAARIVQGFSITAYESLSVAIIGDLYFLHQRGKYMSLINFILGALSNFSSVIMGPITNNLGWRYLFYIFLPFIVSQLILLVLFCPETAYNRDRKLDIDEISREDDSKEEDRRRPAADDHDKIDNAVVAEKPEEAGDIPRSEHVDDSSPVRPTAQHHRRRAPKTFWQRMAIYTGTYTEENLLQLIIAPFAVCLNLSILWVVVGSGALTALFVAVSYVLAQIFSFPPYNLSTSSVGYLSVGPFVGGIFASLALGYIMDATIEWATRRNRGIYEPEFRLLPMVLCLLSGVGLMLFGYLAQEGKSFYATATLHGVALFGIIFGTTTIGGYVLDAYREMSNEVFVMAMVFKNFVFYGFSYFVNDWTARSGPAEVFYVFGAVAFAVTLSTPVVYICGKRYRSFWHRNNWLERLHIRTHAE